jgi:hypothetical protein
MRVREREKYWSFEVIGMLLLFWEGDVGWEDFFVYTRLWFLAGFGRG